nr:HNH endonuclease signature motif containing protein [Corynebacterium lemuris]
MKRTPTKKGKRSVSKKIPKESYNEVFRRAGQQCEVMADPLCTTRAEEWHHRKLRSQGGEHTVENGLAVCAACHRHIHMNPADSYTAGWLVKSTHDPVDVPVTRRGLVVLLTRQGNFIGKEGP